MLTFAPFHRVLARQVPRLPSNSSPIPSLNTHHHPTTLSAPSRVRLQTYAASTARSPSSSSSPLRSKWNKRLRTLGIATLVGAGALWWDGKYNARTLTRNFRTIWHGAAIALDYKLNFNPDDLDSINMVHERAAARLLTVCKKNGGLYVKMGQAIGIQVAVLPKPYHALAQLFDSAEPVPFQTVRQMIHSELEEWPESLFIEFDEIPLGSASIAQVHRAVLSSGETIAVKVQRPDIRRHAFWDLLAFRILTKLYERWFDLPLSFASAYISEQILKETDFEHERENLQRIRALVLRDGAGVYSGWVRGLLSTFGFAGPRLSLTDDELELIDSGNWRGDVYVPKVYPAFSTGRVLTMEYIEGAARMTDRETIEGLKMGLDIHLVMKTVCETIGRQIFRWGFLNADPHPSNVLVRVHPLSIPRRSVSTTPPSPTRPLAPIRLSHRHQIILLDAGLMISLPAHFRYEYCDLWGSLFLGNLPRVAEICRLWGLGVGSEDLIGSLVLLRRPATGSPKGKSLAIEKIYREEEVDEKKSVEKVTKEPSEERKAKELEAQRAMKAKLKGFLENYDLIPKELIFISRSMRIIQANNQALGAPVDRINILAREAAKGLRELMLNPDFRISQPRPAKSANRVPKETTKDITPTQRWIRAQWMYLRIRAAIAGLDALFSLVGLVDFVLSHLWLYEKAYTPIGSGIGGEIEERMKDMAKEFGVELDDSMFEG